ncbi:hypothetical protein A9K97_gp145 [Tokyovirus A1]|uniref:hypothetical protein n=1 Tax=Tokyovirus A1 TaxID=1826170 RepID=UPI0007A9629A|nr:hypothetical protein A9K97_gp145 [Tokyovirus A1]BAU80206.1 conserved hypothetical protein [Tokyovirus A1]
MSFQRKESSHNFEKIVDRKSGKVYVSGEVVTKNLKLLRRQGLLYDETTSSWWYPLRLEQDFSQHFARFQNMDNKKDVFLSKYMNERVHCFLVESAYIAELLRKDTKQVKGEDALLLQDIYGCYKPSFRNISKPVRSSVERWAKTIQENFSQEAKDIIARTVTAQVSHLEKLSYDEIIGRVSQEGAELARKGLKKYGTADKMFSVAVEKIRKKLGTPPGDLSFAFRTILAVLIVLPLEAKQKFYDEASDVLVETRKGEIGPTISLLLSKESRAAKEKLMEQWRSKKLHQAAIELLSEKHSGVLLRKIKKGAILTRSAFFSLS